MEKYSNICKFILISDQLSKIIEPIRSRCLLIRVPLPTRPQIIETILNISNLEDINLDIDSLKYIIDNCDNNVIHAIWLLEMKKYGIEYIKNWNIIIDNIVDMIYSKNIKSNSKLLIIIKKIREYFYNLFITNISSQLIIRTIMNKLLNKISDIKLKYDVIDITSIFEQRLSNGTRHIIHIEAYIIRLIYLFTNNKNNNFNLDVLEI